MESYDAMDDGLEMGHGETAELPVATVSSTETETILVVLTTVFLLIAIALIGIRLHTTYGLWSDKTRSSSSK